MMIFTWLDPSYSGTSRQLFSAALADSLILLISKMPLTYFMLYVSIPKIRENSNKTGRIVAEILLMFTVAILINRALMVYVIAPYIFRSTAAPVPFFELRSLLTAFMSIGCVAGLAAFIKFARVQAASREREKALLKQNLETELKFLRNQTNPHFLFNTLNNIYGLARRKSTATADVVMKLSNLLRFMLYGSKDGQIKISDEIGMLENYIDLERIRYTDLLTLRFDKSIDNDTEPIAPLLLLPFVENAFKHGASESRFGARIGIDLQVQEGNLYFCIENTKETDNQGLAPDNIGLSNVKRQLELLYKEYDLKIQQESTIFKVLLTINLRSYEKI